jgi:hypothetical protein
MGGKMIKAGRGPTRQKTGTATRTKRIMNTTTQIDTKLYQLNKTITT